VLPQGAAILGDRVHAVTSISSIVFTEHIVADQLGGYAMSIYATDIDGDGDMDILSASYDSDISWWENGGDENFIQHVIYDYYYNGCDSVYATDVDGDGDVDVLGASNYYDQIAWWENDGNENFTKHNIASDFERANSVYATDVDGDGDMDVLGAAGTDDDIAWWENDGNEDFTQHTIAGDFDGARSVYATDIDGDNDVDILGAAGTDNDITWWENDGHENFTQHTIAGDFDGANSVYAMDVDGDGDMDVLGAAGTDDDITWWENDGHENFTQHTIAGDFDGARSVYATDIDGDNDVDILGAAGTDDDITWWENDGHKNFTQHTIAGDFDGARSVYATDIDGDGDVDVLGTAYYDPSLAWWENNASDSWPNFELQSMSWAPNEPEVMEDTYIEVVIRNLGPDYDPASGVIYLDLKVQDTADNEWFWRLPGHLDPILANDTEILTIDRFWFTRDEINKVEACVSFEDGEANPSNNCLEQSITVHPNSSNPWRECLGVPIDALVFFIDAKTAGSLSVFQEAGTIFLARAPLIYSACNGVAPWDYNCVKEWIGLGIDAGVTAVKELLPHKVVITLIKDGVMLLLSIADCADNLTQHYIRASIEEARHRNVPVNAVVALSPIYIRAIDSSGRRAGFLDDGSTVLEIPDAEVAESDGSKLVLYPGTDTNYVELTGAGNGTFDLIISISVPDPEVHTVVYEDVSVTTSTTGKIDVASGQYTLALDDDGDGTTDRNIEPIEEIRTRIYRVYLPAIMKSY
jgi:hypothetical protein